MPSSYEKAIVPDRSATEIGTSDAPGDGAPADDDADGIAWPLDATTGPAERPETDGDDGVTRGAGPAHPATGATSDSPSTSASDVTGRTNLYTSGTPPVPSPLPLAADGAPRARRRRLT